jgi:hypothetical protein
LRYRLRNRPRWRCSRLTLNRNPWTGISVWREFCFDARHPSQFFKRGWDNLMGRGDAPMEHRIIFGGCIVVGLACFVQGVVVVILYS